MGSQEQLDPLPPDDWADGSEQLKSFRLSRARKPYSFGSCGCASLLFGVFLMMVSPGTIDSLFQIGMPLFFGWIGFLSRISEKISVNWNGIFTGVLALLAVAVGLHQFLKWYWRSRGQSLPAATVWRIGSTIRIVTLIVFTFVSATAAIGVVHQLTWMTTGKEKMFRRDGFSSRSTSNLTHIGLALHIYIDQYQSLPGGGGFDRFGLPASSWATRLLPYVDQSDIFDSINFNHPWDHPINSTQFSKRIGAYHWSWDTRNDKEDWNGTPYALSSYAGNSRVLMPDHEFKHAEVTDGLAKTIAVGEVSVGRMPWGHPLNVRDPARGIVEGPNAFSAPSTSRNGASFLFLDGSVQFLSPNIDPRVLKALATPNGGEDVKGFGF